MRVLFSTLGHFGPVWTQNAFTEIPRIANSHNVSFVHTGEGGRGWRMIGVLRQAY